MLSFVKNFFSRPATKASTHSEPVPKVSEAIASVLEAIQRCQALNFSRQSLEICLSQMQAIEREVFGANGYRVPFYVWRRHVPEDVKTAVLPALMERLDGQTGPHEHILLVALALRLQADGVDVSKLVARHWQYHLEALSPIRGQELCLILHFHHQFAKLAVVSEHMVRVGLGNWGQQRLFCDWYVQSRYQPLKRKMFQNTLSDEDIGQLEEVVAQCEERLGANDPNVANYRGLLACARGDFEAAVKHHCAGKHGTYHIQFFRAASNVIPVERMRELADANLDPLAGNNEFLSRQHVILRHDKTEDATLIACDDRYYYAFADQFIQSFALNNPGGLLHIHAVDFRPDSDQLDAFEDKYGLCINVTIDPGPEGLGRGDIWSGYCAGARYIHLPRYLEIYDRVIVNDIDGIVHSSMKEVWAGHEGAIMLSTLALEKDRKGHFSFWSNIGAGAFGVEARPEQKAFTKALSGYLIERLDECRRTDQRFFFSDQVGLLLCVLAFGDTVKMTRMRQIFRQSTQAAQAGRHQAKRDAQSKLLAELRGRKQVKP